eukprot:jgi/Ulvmu1/10628/UM066_0007.1
MALNVCRCRASLSDKKTRCRPDHSLTGANPTQGICSVPLPIVYPQPSRRSVRVGATSGNGRDGPGKRRRRQAKASKPGLFEVVEVSPPPHSLGIHSLPPKTHNGDQLSIEGKEYVVTSLILQYKLQRGRYVRDHCKLQVLPTGRYFYNEFLSAMMEMTPDDNDTGKQD